ncbi:MAG: hypothetical protein ABI210_10305, partial [Abditibacteriaceae bacterium]
MRRIDKIKTRYKNTFGSTMGVAALFVGVTLIGISPSARAQDIEGNSLSEKTLPITPGVYAIPGTLPALPPSDPSPPVNTKVLLQPSTPPPDYTKAAKE